jgi:hypothetical protein
VYIVMYMGRMGTSKCVDCNILTLHNTFTIIISWQYLGTARTHRRSPTTELVLRRVHVGQYKLKGGEGCSRVQPAYLGKYLLKRYILLLVHVDICIYICICIYIYIYIYMYMYLYIYIYVYVFIYIYIYPHYV